MYGAQTTYTNKDGEQRFENDVEMYGAQTTRWIRADTQRLRMM